MEIECGGVAPRMWRLRGRKRADRAVA